MSAAGITAAGTKRPPPTREGHNPQPAPWTELSVGLVALHRPDVTGRSGRASSVVQQPTTGSIGGRRNGSTFDLPAAAAAAAASSSSSAGGVPVAYRSYDDYLAAQQALSRSLVAPPPSSSASAAGGGSAFSQHDYSFGSYLPAPPPAPASSGDESPPGQDASGQPVTSVPVSGAVGPAGLTHLLHIVSPQPAAVTSASGGAPATTTTGDRQRQQTAGGTAHLPVGWNGGAAATPLVPVSSSQPTRDRSLELTAFSMAGAGIERLAIETITIHSSSSLTLPLNAAVLSSNPAARARVFNLLLHEQGRRLLATLVANTSLLAGQASTLDGLTPADPQPDCPPIPPAALLPPSSLLSCGGADMFSRFWGNATYADVQLVTPSGHALPAHRIVLAARCEPLHALFSSGMSETGQPRVRMGCEIEVLRPFLQWIYTGRLPHSALIAAAAESELRAATAAAEHARHHHHQQQQRQASIMMSHMGVESSSCSSYYGSAGGSPSRVGSFCSHDGGNEICDVIDNDADSVMSEPPAPVPGPQTPAAIAVAVMELADAYYLPELTDVAAGLAVDFLTLEDLPLVFEWALSHWHIGRELAAACVDYFVSPPVARAIMATREAGDDGLLARVRGSCDVIVRGGGDSGQRHGELHHQQQQPVMLQHGGFGSRRASAGSRASLGGYGLSLESPSPSPHYNSHQQQQAFGFSGNGSAALTPMRRTDSFYHFLASAGALASGTTHRDHSGTGTGNGMHSHHPMMSPLSRAEGRGGLTSHPGYYHHRHGGSFSSSNGSAFAGAGTEDGVRGRIRSSLPATPIAHAGGATASPQAGRMIITEPASPTFGPSAAVGAFSQSVAALAPLNLTINASSSGGSASASYHGGASPMVGGCHSPLAAAGAASLRGGVLPSPSRHSTSSSSSATALIQSISGMGLRSPSNRNSHGYNGSNVSCSSAGAPSPTAATVHGGISSSSSYRPQTSRLTLTPTAATDDVSSNSSGSGSADDSMFSVQRTGAVASAAAGAIGAAAGGMRTPHNSFTQQQQQQHGRRLSSEGGEPAYLTNVGSDESDLTALASVAVLPPRRHSTANVGSGAAGSASSGSSRSGEGSNSAGSEDEGEAQPLSPDESGLQLGSSGARMIHATRLSPASLLKQSSTHISRSSANIITASSSQPDSALSACGNSSNQCGNHSSGISSNIGGGLLAGGLSLNTRTGGAFDASTLLIEKDEYHTTAFGSNSSSGSMTGLQQQQNIYTSDEEEGLGQVEGDDARSVQSTFHYLQPYSGILAFLLAGGDDDDGNDSDDDDDDEEGEGVDDDGASAAAGKRRLRSGSEDDDDGEEAPIINWDAKRLELTSGQWQLLGNSSGSNGGRTGYYRR